MASFHTGAFVGTGADLEMDKPGFRPHCVHLYNITDGSFAMWSEDMPDDAMIKQKAGATTYVTANGITPVAKGFDLGADTDLNAADDVIHFVCWA